MANNGALVQVQNVSKDYALGKTTIPALKDVSMEIQQKDFMVIAGPSGSGKTTLLNIIGLIDEATEGQLVFDGQDLSNTSHKDLYQFRRDRLGYIFQTFNLIPVLNVYENVEYPLILQRIGRSERKARVKAVLHKVGLLDRMTHKPRELSGGQRQRVSIARAIVKNPDVILADEPTANLDSKTGLEVLGVMERLNKEDGMTFIFSSHDPVIIEKGKRVVHLHDGQINNWEKGGGGHDVH